jgi:hypothetical protein
MGSTRYSVGDKVVITEDSIRRMKDSNRSCVTPQSPSDSFIAKAEKLVGVDGEVTHTFPPGYEVTAKFGEQSFHMKDNWIVGAGTLAEERASDWREQVRPSNRRFYPSM